MNLYQQFDDLTRLLGKLTFASPDERRETIMNAVIETGGSYYMPEGTNWSSHMFEVSLYGVSAFGADEDEAIRNWMLAARRVAHAAEVEIEADGFVTVHPKTQPG